MVLFRYVVTSTNGDIGSGLVLGGSFAQATLEISEEYDEDHIDNIYLEYVIKGAVMPDYDCVDLEDQATIDRLVARIAEATEDLPKEI